MSTVLAARLKSRGPLLPLLLSPLLVALTTWILLLIQHQLAAISGVPHVRPFGIVYVVPIALLAVLGGYRAGLLTLGLSVLAAACLLMPPRPSPLSLGPRSLTELFFLVLVGGFIIAGGEAIRRNAALLREQQAAADRQRQFLKDVLASVTDNRLRLCEGPADLPPCLAPAGEPIALSLTDVRALRQRACEAAGAQKFSDERTFDLMTAVAEAAMNAVVHGGGGQGRVCVNDLTSVQVWVEDRGQGIRMEQLPQATLRRGHSTAGTLGHGFWLMLNTVDRLWLLTGETGTTVVLEQERTPPLPAWG